MAVAPAQAETLFIAKVDTKWKFVGMDPHCCINSFLEFWTRKTSLQFQTLVLHRSTLPETPGHEAAVELQYKSFIARNSEILKQMPCFAKFASGCAFTIEKDHIPGLISCGHAYMSGHSSFNPKLDFWRTP